ncbi:MAG TPA: MmcQ/YjbR family DNA-binding protein [Dehalococcoidia bacterium]|nr:MmcQ/YjbR family DNA-binding protein [Dehalococcoidia bacterium]
MTTPNAEDARLSRLSAICLALPEAVREQWGSLTSFSVRKKKFAYFLDNHHGDGIVALCWKAAPGENAARAAADPRRFSIPAYIGHQGWAGLRLDRGPIDWDEVAELAEYSYRLAAPKRLAALLARAPL